MGRSEGLTDDDVQLLYCACVHYAGSLMEIVKDLDGLSDSGVSLSNSVRNQAKTYYQLAERLAKIGK